MVLYFSINGVEHLAKLYVTLFAFSYFTGARGSTAKTLGRRTKRNLPGHLRNVAVSTSRRHHRVSRQGFRPRSKECKGRDLFVFIPREQGLDNRRDGDLHFRTSSEVVKNQKCKRKRWKCQGGQRTMIYNICKHVYQQTEFCFHVFHVHAPTCWRTLLSKTFQLLWTPFVRPSEQVQRSKLSSWGFVNAFRKVEWRKNQLRQMRVCGPNSMYLPTENVGREQGWHSCCPEEGFEDGPTNCKFWSWRFVDTMFLSWWNLGSIQEVEEALASIDTWISPESKSVPAVMKPGHGYLTSRNFSTLQVKSSRTPWELSFSFLHGTTLAVSLWDLSLVP